MVKQNNSLTELQALEGIYEHLSTIDDLAKEVGMISTRLRKIEGQLNGPDIPQTAFRTGIYLNLPRTDCRKTDASPLFCRLIRRLP